MNDDNFNLLWEGAFKIAYDLAKEKEAAVTTKRLFDNYVEAGFTPDQAIILLGTTLGTAAAFQSSQNGGRNE